LVVQLIIGMWTTTLVTVLLVSVFCVSQGASGAGKRVEGALNVHLVCHTHDDVGWLKTVDQYFYGANNSIQFAGVQYILDTVVPNLVANPNRKFIYVEQAFFQRWWREQDVPMQNTVKELVTKGQLEFINGGWCMHDEAGTHYVAMIDQTTLGHRFLKQEFGAVPKVGWQIDPFGHSSTQASLLSARVGFTGLFFARIDYQDSIYRDANKEYEMIWRPSPSLGVNGQIFTGAFERNGYGPPGGFNWDAFSSDAPIQDDPRLEDFNVPQRVEDFVAEVMNQFGANKGDDIMLTLGSDFQYSNAHTWYKNLDKLIDHVNKDGRVNIFYSTPSIYTAAKLASNITWTVKTDDFFPYADCPHCYWTGYFTSRPALKRYVRINSAYLNAARQLEVLIGSTTTALGPYDEAMGVAQHHDAVSGTSKQHVAYDYAFRLAKGAAIAADTVNSALAQIVTKTAAAPDLSQCTLINETICSSTEQFNSFSIVIYNPLARSRSELVRIPVTGPSAYTVYDFAGNVVPSQTVASFEPFPKQKPAPFVVYFRAVVPGLGYATYFVQPASGEKPTIPRQFTPDSSVPVSIENSAVRVEFDSTTGRLSSVTNKVTGLTSAITQDFFYYASAHGDDGFQNSGAYIFRPNSTDSYPACPGVPQLNVVSGPVVSEIRYQQCDWLAQVVRLTGDDSFVEFEYRVGSVPISDDVGKEVISRFTTDVKSASLYYTDSNGREFQTRKRNYRPTWPLGVNEPVAGNYYPMNAAAYIKDATKQVSILNDRSQGVGSINDGQLEIMIHRRLLHDDSRGVGEPLNETDSITPYPDPVRVGTGLHITGSHYLFLDSPINFAPVRNLQSRIFHPFVTAFSPLARGVDAVKQWIATHNVQGSAIKTDLPVNVDLLTLQVVDGGNNILRLSHQFAVGEDPVLSKPVTVDLATLFTSLKLNNLKEVSLTANQDVSAIEDNLAQVNVRGPNADVNTKTYPTIPFVCVSFFLNPMDVITFTFTL
jgi:hypothetical protein